MDLEVTMCNVPANRWCLIYGRHLPPLRAQRELKTPSGAHAFISHQWTWSLKRAQINTREPSVIARKKCKQTLLCKGTLDVKGSIWSVVNSVRRKTVTPDREPESWRATISGRKNKECCNRWHSPHRAQISTSLSQSGITWRQWDSMNPLQNCSKFCKRVDTCWTVAWLHRYTN